MYDYLIPKSPSWHESSFFILKYGAIRTNETQNCTLKLVTICEQEYWLFVHLSVDNIL